MNGSVRDYAHPELNRDITAIGGHYVVTKEARLPYQGEEVLYFVGQGILDRTCCGFGAVCYAGVAGYVHRWKYARDQHDRSVSQVEPVSDAREQSQIEKLIRQIEPMISQVNFIPV